MLSLSRSVRRVIIRAINLCCKKEHFKTLTTNLYVQKYRFHTREKYHHINLIFAKFFYVCIFLQVGEKFRTQTKVSPILVYCNGTDVHVLCAMSSFFQISKHDEGCAIVQPCAYTS